LTDLANSQNRRARKIEKKAGNACIRHNIAPASLKGIFILILAHRWLVVRLTALRIQCCNVGCLVHCPGHPRVTPHDQARHENTCRTNARAYQPAHVRYGEVFSRLASNGLLLPDMYRHDIIICIYHNIICPDERAQVPLPVRKGGKTIRILMLFVTCVYTVTQGFTYSTSPSESGNRATKAGSGIIAGQ
jgi:hypothetical protein